MDNKGKIIEEMTKVIRPILENRTDICFIPDLDKPIAEELLKHYQPKLPKDSVVLSREEYEKGVIERESMRKQITELFNDREQARKETATDILQEWADDNNSMGLDNTFVKNIAEKYGVEIEE